MATSTRTHAIISEVEGMGRLTRTYTEQVLELGTRVYTEVDTYDFLGGGQTIYTCDLMEMKSGRWAIASVSVDDLTGRSEEYKDVSPEWAEAFIRTHRQEHGELSAA